MSALPLARLSGIAILKVYCDNRLSSLGYPSLLAIPDRPDQRGSGTVRAERGMDAPLNRQNAHTCQDSRNVQSFAAFFRRLSVSLFDRVERMDIARQTRAPARACRPETLEHVRPLGLASLSRK